MNETGEITLVCGHDALAVGPSGLDGSHPIFPSRSSLEGLAFLLFLVGYWPDLAPIEEAFSKLKTALRRTGARTREALEEAIAESVTHDHGSGCLRLVPALWLPRF